MVFGKTEVFNLTGKKKYSGSLEVSLYDRFTDGRRDTTLYVYGSRGERGKSSVLYDAKAISFLVANSPLFRAFF